MFQPYTTEGRIVTELRGMQKHVKNKQTKMKGKRRNKKKKKQKKKKFRGEERGNKKGE